MALPIAAAGAYSATQSLLSSGGPKAAASFASAVSGAGGGDFAAMLEKAARSVAETGQRADTAAMSAASGKADLVDVVTAVAESETALQTLVAVRDRVISAYEDMMRMPI